MNFVKQPKQRVYDDALERRAIEFHGHDGPFMTIGLRMGLHALDALDCKGWFDIRCTVYLSWRPPDSCVIDGIQSSTGCTMGKHNIEVVEGRGVRAEFSSKGKTISLTLRPDVYSRIKGGLGEDEDIPHRIMEELERAEIHEIFDVDSG